VYEVKICQAKLAWLAVQFFVGRNKANWSRRCWERRLHFHFGGLLTTAEIERWILQVRRAIKVAKVWYGEFVPSWLRQRRPSDVVASTRRVRSSECPRATFRRILVGNQIAHRQSCNQPTSSAELNRTSEFAYLFKLHICHCR